MRCGSVPDQSLQLSRKPQELCAHRTSAHSSLPSLFSAFLHHISNSCVLQPACPQPFLLHFPPSRPLLLFSLLLSTPCFPPHSYPTRLCPLCPASDQHTSPAHACQELSAAHCAQDTTQHDIVPGCSGSSKHNEEMTAFASSV